MLSKIQGYRPDLPTYGFSHTGGAKWNRKTQAWEHTGKAVCSRPILNSPMHNPSLDETERAFTRPPKEVGESGHMLAALLEGVA
jgi:hypothetical protein